MEEKDFAWVCATLSAAEARVPVPETVFISKGEVSLWIYPSPTDVLQRRLFPDTAVPSLSQAVQHFEAMHSHEHLSSSTICLVNTKGSLIALTEDRIEEAKAQHGVFSRCSYIQLPISSQTTLLFYLIRLDLLEGKYRSSFSIRRTVTRPCSDQRIYAKLISYVKIVLKTLEMSRKRRVEKLELEFFVSIEGEVWLCNCPICILGPLSRNNSHKGDISLFPDNPKANSLFKGLQFQPRVCTPLQFQSPASPSLLSPTLPSQSRPVSKPGLNPRTNSQSLVMLPPSSSGKRGNTGFYHPNFIEILAKRYAKTNNWLSEDFQTIFRDMDSKLLQIEESPLKQSKAYSNRHNSLGIDSFEAEIGGKLDHMGEIKTEPSAERPFLQAKRRRNRVKMLTAGSRTIVREKPFSQRVFEPLLHRKRQSLVQISRRYNFTVVKDSN